MGDDVNQNESPSKSTAKSPEPNGALKKIANYWYRDDDVLGKGAYGAVLRAYDDRINQNLKTPHKYTTTVNLAEQTVEKTDEQMRTAASAVPVSAKQAATVPGSTNGTSHSENASANEDDNLSLSMPVRTELPDFLKGARAVALKRMCNPNEEDGVAASTLREIMVLRELSHRLRADQRPSSVLRFEGMGTYAPQETADTPLADAGNAPGLTSPSNRSRRSPNDWSTSFNTLNDDGDDEECEDEDECVSDAATTSPQNAKDLLWKGLVSAAMQLGRKNIIDLYDVMVDKDSSVIYAALEYCDGGDLWHYLRDLPNRRIAEPLLFRRWMRELLQGLAFMHDRHITHRDLKPQNLMLKTREDLTASQLSEATPSGEKFTIKIGDFGLSRLEDIPVKKYVHEAVTLWYRSPDVLLGNTNFSYSADAWSTGCIMAEIACGTALFRGKDSGDQLKRIFARVGGPTELNLPEMNDYPYSEEFEDVLSRMKQYAAEERKRAIFTDGEAKEEEKLRVNPGWCEHNRRSSFALCSHVAAIKARLRAYFVAREGFDVLGEDGLDLVARFLVFDPKQRLTVIEALQHPFFKLDQDEELKAMIALPASQAETSAAGKADTPAVPWAPNEPSNSARQSITGVTHDSTQLVPRPPTNTNRSNNNSAKSSITGGLLPRLHSGSTESQLPHVNIRRSSTSQGLPAPEAAVDAVQTTASFCNNALAASTSSAISSKSGSMRGKVGRTATAQATGARAASAELKTDASPVIEAPAAKAESKRAS